MTHEITELTVNDEDGDEEKRNTQDLPLGTLQSAHVLREELEKAQLVDHLQRSR